MGGAEGIVLIFRDSRGTSRTVEYVCQQNIHILIHGMATMIATKYEKVDGLSVDTECRS